MSCTCGLFKIETSSGTNHMLLVEGFSKHHGTPKRSKHRMSAKVARIVDRVNITTLESEPATQLEANAIGDVVLALQQPLAVLPFTRSRALGSLVLVDTASHRTSAAVLVQPNAAKA